MFGKIAPCGLKDPDGKGICVMARSLCSWSVLMLAEAILLLSDPASALEYDPYDFAVEVVRYVPGVQPDTDPLNGEPYDDPNAALGAPTRRTTGDGENISPLEAVPVVPVYPAFRHFELVTIGQGGELVLKFSHPVADDINNPYGMDFIVFGNSLFSGENIDPNESNEKWINGNPEYFSVGSTLTYERGTVSVSQDGQRWYAYDSGPFADDFAPTASYLWDDGNDVWAEELDPTVPMPPDVTSSDFLDMTVAEVIEMYEGSAGGTAFDIGQFGLDWIMYVRIQDRSPSAATTEIDAIADVSACGDYKNPYPEGDLNHDCRVDLADLAIFSDNWLTCNWQCD